MAGLSSIAGGLGNYQSFRMMTYRTLRFPGSEFAQAIPSAMDQRFGYHQPIGPVAQFPTHSAVLGLRPFLDHGHPDLTYIKHQANRGLGPFKAGLDIYV